LIVIAHFENPARAYARDFLKEVLGLRKRCIVPLSTYFGAYIIMTRYLRIVRKEVAKALVTTLSIDSPAFYENIPRYTAIEAIKTSEGLNISSWDSYLLELARSLNIKRIYTIDEELKRKVKDFEVINPIPSDVMKEYHEYVARRIKT
jgi:predicted nucleic acid-binding protein